MYILSAEFKAIPTSLNMKQATKYMTFSRMYAFLFIYQIQEYPVVTRFFFAPIAQWSGVRMIPFENQE